MPRNFLIIDPVRHAHALGMIRHRILPARGRLLVSTDLHGNLADLRALEAVFVRERSADAETHWAVLGDVVHGPSHDARRDHPDLYDYDDASSAIVHRLLELRAAHPDHVHFILGNHDHAHVGGPRRSTQARVVHTLLGSYGQPAATASKMLAQVSASSGLDLRVVVHGHDKSEEGFFYEGGNQVCPVLFGAHRETKRYALLDLAARYERAEDLRDGVELRRLHA